MDNLKCVAIIAPAGGMETVKIEDRCKALNSLGIETVIMPHVLKDNGLPWHSSALQNRLDDLHDALRDPDIDALWCTRGGVGSAALLPHIDWDLMRKRNLPLIGYSDITALHLAMLSKNAGIPVVAPMIGKLPKAVDCEFTTTKMKQAFSAEEYEICTLSSISPGLATALPVAANLTVTASLCGTGFMPDLSGKILIIEDINESAYRLDRCLVQLQQCGVLNDLSGLVFGEFTGCGKPELLITLFRHWAAELDCPIWTGFPFGHEFPLAAINMSRPIAISPSGLVSCLT
jgi:muramoyltetrapeptide carboxypeptidase